MEAQTNRQLRDRLGRWKTRLYTYKRSGNTELAAHAEAQVESLEAQLPYVSFKIDIESTIKANGHPHHFTGYIRSHNQVEKEHNGAYYVDIKNWPDVQDTANLLGVELYDIKTKNK